jgi:hypothetical protein
MELRQPEAFGVLNDHDACFRYIDADLDHRGCNQNAGRAFGKARHRPVLFGAAHAAVDQCDRVTETLAQRLIAFLGGGKVDAFGFPDQRTDPINPAAVVEGTFDCIDHFAEPFER